ncbi:PepSY-associated TM helix domain-containing protein [Hyphomonas sp.]|uniref:PepSY-associated TM helix domain-containing protein n=1 Tax=Hyphomonas sp. TaxID=87 RepID=UPI0025C70274|nr:PepSY-associated TM helix domain-containing protein [Hyphomonas sp.]MBI1399305.1 PepSY domain-containing protein [Hyphomonas sp.]
MLALRTAHAWSGAVLSLLIAILGVSGTLLVFKEDYLRLVFPESRQAVSLAAEDLGPVLNRIEAAYGGDGLRYVALGDTQFGLHKAVMQDDSAAYIDGDGNTVARWARNGRVEDWLFDLHHHLLAGEVGEVVGGVAGGAAVLMSITGLIIVWPSLRMFRWRVWPRTGARRDLLAQHRDLGVIFAVPILLIAFTGFAMVFSEPVRATLHTLTASRPAPAPERLEAGAGPADWTTALKAAETAFPEAAPRLVSLPAKPGAPASLRLRNPEEWHPNGRTYVLLDPATSLPLATRDGRAMNRADRLYNSFYPLHSAGLGGRLYDVFTALTGLALTLLGLVGTWTFLKRPPRRRKAVPPA